MIAAFVVKIPEGETQPLVGRGLRAAFGTGKVQACKCAGVKWSRGGKQGGPGSLRRWLGFCDAVSLLERSGSPRGGCLDTHVNGGLAGGTDPLRES